MERTVEDLEQELKTEHNLHLRALADFDNFRRRVNREREHIGKEALRELFFRQGAESTPESTPDGFMRHMQEEYLRYQALIRGGGIKAE